MKRVMVLLALALAFSLAALAEEWSGYISDAKCTESKGAKVASDAHAGCAQGCIKKGSAAVLVTSEGKIYKIANQDKVVDHAGHKVTLEGKLEGDTITVSDVKM